MKALIFAAGLGTRLRPLTLDRPKALVELGGVTMLERTIARLRDSGVDEIVVNAYHFAEKVVSFVESRDFGIPVRVVVESGIEPLETGGGIFNARKYLEDSPGGCFLIHNVDIFSDADLVGFMAGSSFDGVEAPLARMLVRRAESDRYLLVDDGMRLAGWTDVRTGQVKSPFPDFDPLACTRYAFTGIHILSTEAFSLMQGWPERFGIMDFYLSVCGKRRIECVCAPDTLKLVDIGTPQALSAAQQAFFGE